MAPTHLTMDTTNSQMMVRPLMMASLPSEADCEALRAAMAASARCATSLATGDTWSVRGSRARDGQVAPNAICTGSILTMHGGD
jgi:hypothetical protein